MVTTLWLLSAESVLARFKCGEAFRSSDMALFERLLAEEEATRSIPRDIQFEDFQEFVQLTDRLEGTGKGIKRQHMVLVIPVLKELAILSENRTKGAKLDNSSQNKVRLAMRKWAELIRAAENDRLDHALRLKKEALPLIARITKSTHF